MSQEVVKVFHRGKAPRAPPSGYNAEMLELVAALTEEHCAADERTMGFLLSIAPRRYPLP